MIVSAVVDALSVLALSVVSVAAADAVVLDAAVAWAVATGEAVPVPIEDEAAGVLQAARDPARARAAIEDAKRTENLRVEEGDEVVIGTVKGRTLIQP